MCGQETPSSTPRIGARVDFFPAPGHTQSHLPLGNLLFVNPTSPTSSHATHVRFLQHHSPLNNDDKNNNNALLVSIHETGDLTAPLSSAGLLRQFTLRQHQHAIPRSGLTQEDDGRVEMMPLDATVALSVGGRDGIIGRRVSMRRGGELLADGIVGFNTW